jgi:hypothetical protein
MNQTSAKAAVVALVLLFLSCFNAAAQSPFVDDGFFAPPQAKAPWLLDWGGTVSPAILSESQGEPLSVVAGMSGNVWARLSLPAGWQYYARIRDNALLTVLPADAGFELVNLWEVNANYLQLTEADAGFSLAVGRKSFQLGSGLVLSGNGDGVEAQLNNQLFSAKAFGFYTGMLEPGFSTVYSLDSWDDANGAWRYVGGYSVGVGLYGQELALLGLYQGDFGQGTKPYTSWYSGLQAKGMLLGGDYVVEGYLEDGRGPDGAAIEAFAATARYNRVFKLVTTPGVSLQYSVASGDPDRTVGDGSAGNASGTDLAFQAFGQVGSGSVFRPYFSNIHIAQLGASFRPLERAGALLRDSSLGLRYFYYAKYDKAGIVNVDDAALPSHDLGHGVDLMVRWAPWNDVSTFLNAGAFLPGAAFPAGEPLRFTVSGGMSLSF